MRSGLCQARWLSQDLDSVRKEKPPRFGLGDLQVTLWVDRTWPQRYLPLVSGAGGGATSHGDRDSAVGEGCGPRGGNPPGQLVWPR